MKIARQVFSKIKKSDMGDQSMVFDGKQRACGMRKLPSDLNVIVDYDNDRSIVVLQYDKVALVSGFSTKHGFGKGDQADDILVGMTLLFNNAPSMNYTPVGRGFYGLPEKRPIRISGGFELWKGFKQSVLPGKDKLFLNVNYAITTFVRPGMITDLMSELLELRDGNLPQFLNFRQNRMLSDKLRGCKAEATHTNKRVVIESVSKEGADKITFKDRSGSAISVAKYFQQNYPKIPLRFPQWPCAIVGIQKKQYYPLEILKIVSGNPYTGDYAPTSQIIIKAAVSPLERFHEIKKTLSLTRNDSMLSEFGINVSENTKVKMRTLPMPTLTAGGGATVAMKPGVLDFKRTKFATGAKISRCTIVNTSERIYQDDIFNYLEIFKYQSAQLGMSISAPMLDRNQFPFLDGRARDLLEFEEKLEKLIKTYNLEFVMFAIDDNSPAHASIKYVCDVKLGVSSKCIKGASLFKVSRNYREKRMDDQLVLNILYGLNPKFDGVNVKGVNTEFAYNMLMTDATSILGIDVNHGRASVTGSKKAKFPSTVGIVGSRSLDGTLYTAFMIAQRKAARSEDREVVQPDALAPAFKEILLQFHRSTGKKPARIVVSRDGVSIGQFPKVLVTETQTMIDVCAGLPGDYRPPITYVTVQKRHGTRLFPEEVEIDNRGRQKENPVAGSVVDDVITCSNVWNYFLVSHEGIQGTSKPAHYTVLLDENNFTSDQLQSLSYYMCHVYGKCPRAVSTPAPTYYAHWTALRAAEIDKHKLTLKFGDDDSSSGGGHPSTSGRGSMDIDAIEEEYLSLYTEAVKVRASHAAHMYFL